MVFALLIVAVRPSFSADTERGKDIYARYCWWCHGESGEGNGPAADFLNPQPRDFTYGLYKWKSTPFDELTPGHRDFLAMLGGDAIRGKEGWSGLKGTAMPGWKGVLKDGAINDVIAYIKSLAELGVPELAPVDLSGQIKNTIVSIKRGSKLFADNCSECHGKEGRGDGTKRLKDDFGIRTWPRDLTKPWTFRGGSTAEDIYTRITVGILGTQMPSFDDPESKKRLSAKERWDIANYVTTLAEPLMKPSSVGLISALKVDGALPDNPDDELWDKALYRSFYLAPQIIAPERLFTPTVDSISVKSLYNDDEAAFLLMWDDRTESLPGQKASAKLAEGEVFRDGAAVELPIKRLEGAKRPYFGMGDARDPVRILFWQGGSSSAPERLSLITARGEKNISSKPAPAAFSARGLYSNGRWRVVMKGPLKALYTGLSASTEEEPLIPLAFALWDGSNGEKGSRHVFSGWHWLALKAEEGRGHALLWALVVFGLVFLAELIIARELRSR